MKKRDHGILSGAFWLTLSAVFVKVFGVFYKIPLSYMLGDEGMGYFNTGYTVFSVFFILCASGIPKAITLILTDPLRQKGDAVASTLTAFGVFGGLCSVLVAVFAVPIAKALGSEEACFCLLFMSPSVLLCAVSGVYRGALIARNKMQALALCDILSGGVKLVFGLLFAKAFLNETLSLALGAAGAILGLTVGSLCTLVFLLITYKRIKTEENIKQKFDFSILKSVVNIALPVTAGALLMSFCNVCDMVLIQRNLVTADGSDHSAVAAFGNYSTLVVPMFGLCASVISAVCTSALPKLSKSFSQNDREGYHDTSRSVILLLSACSALLSVALFSFPERILSLLFADGSAASAAPLLRQLAPAVLFLSLSSYINLMFESEGNTKIPFYSMAIASVFKVAVCFLLIRDPKFGILAAPIGTSVFYLVSFAVAFSLTRKKRFSQVRVLSLHAFFLLLAFVSSKAASAVCGTSRFIQNDDILTVIIGLSYALIFCILLLLLYCIPLYGKMTVQFAQKLKTVFGKINKKLLFFRK